MGNSHELEPGGKQVGGRGPALHWAARLQGPPPQDGRAGSVSVALLPSRGSVKSRDETVSQSGAPRHIPDHCSFQVSPIFA